ncbi:MAG TPA: flagellar hook-basal body complex protein [Pseudomonadales bacterium]|nr:flagellar hook-basal body complex protein [Pseudomonadales bacterium]
MTFNTALSGLSAASSDLSVTGNNIANASTVGFKASRAEFADVYASSLLGSGSKTIGSGVKLASVAQQFDQGTISFTNNALDLAIDGNGFFVTAQNGARAYTRAGSFGVDNQGYLVTSTGDRVQGFAANSTGALSGVVSDLKLQTTNLAPRQTTLVQGTMNLDARQGVLSQIGTKISSLGSAIGLANGGLPAATSSELDSGGPPTPFNYGINAPSTISAANAITPFDFSQPNNHVTFQVSMTGSSTPSQNQTVNVTLNTNVTNLQDMINDIRNDLTASGIGVDVREDPNNPGRLQFYSTSSGENSSISVDPADNAVYGAGVTRANLVAALGGISVGQGGLPGSTNTNADPFGTNGATGGTGNITAASFDVTLSGAAQNNGTVTVHLDSNITNVNDLINDIRDDLLPSGVGVDVREDPNNPGRLQFYSTVSGEPSTITISNINASNIGVTPADVAATLNLATGVTVPGAPGVTNGYAAQSVQVLHPDGSSQTVTTPANASAAEIAAAFSSTNVSGVSASASTTATIPAGGLVNASGTLAIRLNGVTVSGATANALANSINAAPGLGTVSAAVNPSGDLVITDKVGNDLTFDVVGGTAADSVQVRGTQGTPVTLSTVGTPAAAIGGSVDFSLQEGYTLANAAPATSNIFGSLDPSSFTPFQLNTFDPTNQDSYNAATSMTIYDSLGNAHVMSMYFVKERYTPGVAGEEPNRWSMYVQIDGKDVGDPNPNLPPPANSDPTRSRFDVQFNPDGTIDPSGTDQMLISNWVPLDPKGQPNGAVGPQNVLGGGSLPIPQPPASSNFEIRLGKSTQYGSDFAVSQIDQDGYTTGQISGLNIDSQGVIAARFTNGQNQTLGQIALAHFANVQGLHPIGDSNWVETSDSGAPVVGAPSSGSLGAITSGALEDSNVELSDQLVQLIVAQRNFQANARTISTEDEITKTIINI